MHIMLKFNVFIYLLFLFIANLNAVNHWMVTQSGKVQAYVDSPFALKEPHDLLALLDQESRRNAIDDVYDELLNRKTILQNEWSILEKNSDETVNAKNDHDCLSAEKPFLQLDLYNNIATNGTERGITVNIPEKYHSNESDEKTEDIPACRDFTDLQKSETFFNRTNIDIEPEISLKEKFLSINSLHQFGDYIVQSLRDNSSSWFHYNLASFYWRIKGDGNKAIDCLKLAIQFNEGSFQDIPLHNLAGILHQSHHSKEAIPILNKAIEFAPNITIHYFALANVYAAIGDFNQSIEAYERILKIEPSNKDATSKRHSVLCFRTVDKGLNALQSDVEKILVNLRQYQELEQNWFLLQDRLETSTIDYQYDPVHSGSEISRKGQRCIKKTTNGKTGIACGSYETPPDLGEINIEKLSDIVENAKMKLNLSNSLPKLNINQQQRETFKERKRRHSFSSGTSSKHETRPKHVTLESNFDFDSNNWPDEDECLEWDMHMEDINISGLSVFLPPENKGYSVKKALSDYLDLPPGTQHKLPWHPPNCVGNNVNGKRFINMDEQDNVLEKKIRLNDYMKSEFLKYADNNDSDECEIGQRIVSAMEKGTAPKWVLATVASVYWRIRGNLRKTLDCLDMAFHQIPQKFIDVVLVSFGSIMFELGYTEEALASVRLSYERNDIEPSTNFLLALIHFKKNNQLDAIKYMKKALTVDPDYYGGLAKNLLKTWACNVKLPPVSEKSKKAAASHPAVTCPSADEHKDESLCENDDENCETVTANIQCFRKEKFILVPHESAENLNENQEMCNGDMVNQKNLGDTFIADLIAADGNEFLEQHSVDVEDIYDPEIQRNVHMGLILASVNHHLKEFKFGTLSVSLEGEDKDQRFQIHDTYGTYFSISPQICRNVNLLTPFKYSQIWNILKEHFVDISAHVRYELSNTPTNSKPYCSEQIHNNAMPHGLNDYLSKILNMDRDNIHDKDLRELLQLISSNHDLTVRELGMNIAAALSQDKDNWELLTAAAIYWITYGDAGNASICLRAAIDKVDQPMLDIPISLFSHLLANFGLYGDALKLSNVALSINPKFVWNHFRISELYIRQNRPEQSVPYLRACLKLDNKFEPARIRFKAVLCKLLYENGYKQIRESFSGYLNPL